MADAKLLFRSFVRSPSADVSKHWSKAWFKTPKLNSSHLITNSA